jgi:hypothetical protein
MRCFSGLMTSVAVIVVVSGCGGYRTVEKPWRPQLDGSEFNAVESLNIGDRVRVIVDHAEAIEGILTDVNDDYLVIVETANEPRAATVATDSISRIEVYYARPDVQKITFVAATTALVYAIVKSAMRDTPFSPDESAVKALAR